MNKIIVGLMRYSNLDEYEKFEKFIFECLKRNLDTFDTADIYGANRNEKLIGLFIKNNPSLRSKMNIISKTGIIMGSKDNVGHLNLSYDYVVDSCFKSLNRLNTSYLDYLLIHRPSPFVNYHELAQAINFLVSNNKIKNFGVSNFYPEQIKALQRSLDQYNITIKANQIEVNAYCIEHFKNFNIDYCSSNNIQIQAWSPLGGLYSILDNLEDIKYQTTYQVISEIALIHKVTPIHIMYAFIACHPANISIITGTTDYLKLDTAIESLQIELSLNEWFKIYTSTQGHAMP